MSTRVKRIISVILAAVLAFGVFSVMSFAEDTVGEETAAPAADSSVDTVVKVKSPLTVTEELAATIVVPGISQSVSTYCDENGEPILDKNGNKLRGGLLIIDSSDIVSLILKKLAFPLLLSLLAQTPSKKLASGVYETVCELFKIQQSDKKGNPVNNLVVDTYNYPLSEFNTDDKGWFYRMIPMQPVVNAVSETYGVNAEDYIYLYTFPLLGDPIKAGEGLVDYIEMVKAQTGCKKVNLVGISLGGSVVSAYMDVKKEMGGDFSDLDKVIGVVACFDGTDLFADFYDRKWNLADEFLYGSYIPTIMQESGSEEYVGHLINIALRILPKKVLYTILTAAMDGMLDTLLVNNPQFWAMVPGDRYEPLAARYFADAEYAELKAKTDRFQQARLNLDENLLYANENYGTEVYTVSGYGRQYDSGDYCFLGIAGSSKTSNSDSIIDVDSTSLGATYAVAGQSLGREGAYISPEGEIDASTCTFKDTAWFFYGQHHEVGRADVVLKLLAAIVSNQVKDINSSKAFPEFNYNRNTKNLIKPDGMMETAEEVIANEKGEYTAEQVATVKAAYDKAQAMLDNTVLTPDSEQEAIDMTAEMQSALATVGLWSAPSKPSFTTRLLNSVTRSIDNAIMKTVGGQGFSDSKK